MPFLVDITDASAPVNVRVTARGNGEPIAQGHHESEGICHILPEYFHPWTPEDPLLCMLDIEAGEDRVERCFAMRKIGTVEHRGRRVLSLNNKPHFHNGLLDQGYWPGGLCTAPSHEAPAYDIRTMKRPGFNMLRKHIKGNAD